MPIHHRRPLDRLSEELLPEEERPLLRPELPLELPPELPLGAETPGEDRPELTPELPEPEDFLAPLLDRLDEDRE